MHGTAQEGARHRGRLLAISGSTPVLLLTRDRHLGFWGITSTRASRSTRRLDAGQREAESDASTGYPVFVASTLAVREAVMGSCNGYTEAWGPVVWAGFGAAAHGLLLGVPG